MIEFAYRRSLNISDKAITTKNVFQLQNNFKMLLNKIVLINEKYCIVNFV